MANRKASSSLDSIAFHNTGVWKYAPRLKGTTNFEKHPNVNNIMVTGGAGFTASWVIRHLVLTYPHYRVVSFDNLEYCSSLNNTHLITDNPNFEFFYGDINKADDVLNCFAKHKIDAVMHFAAYTHVDLSFENSVAFTKVNVVGTHELLECARIAAIDRFIYVSTDEVYGEVPDRAQYLPEESILKPTNPYAASKAAAEGLVNSYLKSFNLPVIIVRSNNVYGPHQFPEKMIPKSVCLLLREQKLVVHGDGSHRRNYLFASDFTDAFDTVLHKGVIGEIYNINSRDETTNLQLCSSLLAIFGKNDSNAWIKHVRDRRFNDRRYAIDASKLRALGWDQKVSFEDGLQQTVEWYRQYGESWWGDITAALTAHPLVEARGKGWSHRFITPEESHWSRKTTLRSPMLYQKKEELLEETSRTKANHKIMARAQN